MRGQRQVVQHLRRRGERRQRVVHQRVVEHGRAPVGLVRGRVGRKDLRRRRPRRRRRVLQEMSEHVGPKVPVAQGNPRQLVLGRVGQQAAQHSEVGVAEAFRGVEVGGVHHHAAQGSGPQACGHHPPRHHLLCARTVGAEV